MSRAKRDQLKKNLSDGEFVLAPGIYEMISAKVADRMGFKALYMTGYGVAASHLGLPDAGLTTYTDMVGRASVIAGGTDTPLIADADTGFGGLINVRHTVRGYEAAGVAAIQIEDQEIPKKCGHTMGRKVVALEDMLMKIKVAVDARKDGMLVIARTDARTDHGLNAALDRGAAFAEAGADVVFIESPETEDELQQIGALGKKLGVPMLANMVQGGRTPIVETSRLQDWGFGVAIYPGAGFLAAMGAMDHAFAYIRDNGTSKGLDGPQFGESVHDLVGFPDVWEFEKKYALPD